LIVRVVSEAVPRILALIALWSVVAHLGPAIAELGSVTSPYQAIETLWSLAVSMLAIASIATVSPTLFVATLLAMAVSGLSVAPLTRIVTVIALLAMLAFDVVRKGYRSSQSRGVEIRVDPRGAALTAVPLVAIALVVVYSSGFVARLVSEASSLVQRAFARSGLEYLATALSNPFVEMALIGILTYVVYRLVAQGFEIAALFAYPSLRLSMTAIMSRSDIDRAISIPLTALRSLILGSLFAPPVYAAIYYVALPSLEKALPGASHYLSSPGAQFLIALGVLIALSLAMRTVSFEKLWRRPLAFLGVSAAIALVIYGCSTYLAVAHGTPVEEALLHPDLRGFGRIVASTYLGYYSQFVYVVNTVLRLMGAAP